MSDFKNAAPRFIFDGIDDQSVPAQQRELQSYPVHLPLVRLFTETGPESTVFLGAGSTSFNEIFGAKTLDRRGKFFNNQSLLTELLLARANPIAVKRLIPDDAKKARLVLGIDMVEDQIPAKTNSLDGFDYPDGIDAGDTTPTDENGDPIMVTGVRARLVLMETDKDVGQVTSTEGSIVSADEKQSTIYPLIELPASFYGKGGDLKGFRMWAPSLNDARPFDEDASEDFQARMYRMQFVSRRNENVSPVVTKTTNGESYLDICFVPGTYSESTDKEFFAPDVVNEAYSDDGFTSGMAPVYAPFSEFYLYQENLEMVQETVYAAELALNPSAEETITAAGLVDIFTGKDLEGNPHHSLLLEGPIKGGLLLGEDQTVYAQGGADGDVSLASYEEKVTRENANFGNLEEPYAEMAYYPFTTIYDTGLTMDGKMAMMNVLGQRSDMVMRFTTLVEEENRHLTLSEETSREQALMQALRAYPESLLYGTPVCRADIILQSGSLAEGNYRKPVPQVIDYACKWADFGAETAGLTEGADIDVYPNNIVDIIKDPNVKFFNDRTASSVWENGGTWTKPFDRRSQYYPALRSVYAEDSSVLLSPITVAICGDVIRIAYNTHAYFSGNSRLTQDQLVEQCDNHILEQVSGRYQDRVVVQPRTYFTPADEVRGYTWHCEAVVYANNVRTVMIFDTITRRMEDLPNG